MALTSRRDADAFARRLDGEPAGERADAAELDALVRLARALPRPAVAPDAGFVARLRADLVTAAEERAATLGDRKPARPAGASTPDGPGAPRTVVLRRPGRLLPVALATVLGLAILLVGLSTRALPGDRLYPVKVGIGQAQVRLAGSDLARGRALLGQVDHRLDDVSRLVGSGDPSAADVNLALDQAAVDLTRAQRLLLNGDDGRPDPRALQSLADAGAVAAGRLAQLSSQVPTESLPALHRLQTLLAVGDAAVRQQVKACGAACAPVQKQLDAAGPLALPPGVVGALPVVGAVPAGGPTRASPSASPSRSSGSAPSVTVSVPTTAPTQPARGGASLPGATVQLPGAGITVPGVGVTSASSGARPTLTVPPAQVTLGPVTASVSTSGCVVGLGGLCVGLPGQQTTP